MPTPANGGCLWRTGVHRRGSRLTEAWLSALGPEGVGGGGGGGGEVNQMGVGDVQSGKRERRARTKLTILSWDGPVTRLIAVTKETKKGRGRGRNMHTRGAVVCPNLSDSTAANAGRLETAACVDRFHSLLLN